MGFDRAHDSPLRSKRYEALLSVAILDEVRSGECHESRDRRTRNGDLTLGGDEELAWSFRTRMQRNGSGGDSTAEVQSSSFQGENPRSGLNWLYLAMTLLKTLF